jgi:hypothetical protein
LLPAPADGFEGPLSEDCEDGVLFKGDVLEDVFEDALDNALEDVLEDALEDVPEDASEDALSVDVAAPQAVKDRINKPSKIVLPSIPNLAMFHADCIPNHHALIFAY